MASRKQEIRKEIKKKNAKLGIDVEAAKNIVDLQDQQGENIHVDDFKNQEYGTENYLTNWPMLYILENGKEAYIGESNHVKTRMNQHHMSVEKSIFDKVHFIYSKQFNQSVTFDYESKLIQYIVADEKFVVINKNAGIADKEYFDKEKYDVDFHILWHKLQREKLAKHSIEEIENSDLFKYSPFKELNDDQRDAVDKITQRIKQNPYQAIVVNGMPGSGKTIVAIYIMKLLRDSEEYKNKKIGFVVPPTSLRKTLSKVFRSIYGLKATDVIGPSDIVKQHYDILLVDEAHRLHQYKNIVNRASFKANCKALGLTTESDELDWIMQQCDCPILFYDKMQVVGPSGINIERFDEKMKLEQNRRLVTYYSLLTQMRVNGGNDYINLVNSILSGKCNQQACLKNYDFKVMSDFNRFNNLQQKLEDEFTLSRMIAGYAWEWKSKKDKSLYDMELDGVKKQWNYRLENWVLSEGADKQVGCIHTIQGFDLNYGFVIMGNEIGYDPESKEIIVRPENYYDQNGRKTASKEELLEYIKHIYYVLMTRGIKGTYLYICDDNLRKYVSSIIGVI